MFFLSAKDVPWGNSFIVLSIANHSPVKIDSLIFKELFSIILASAEILSPGRKIIISPIVT